MVTKAKKQAEDALHGSERSKVEAITASKAVDDSRIKAEKTLEKAIAARKAAEETTELMLGREERI